MFSFRSGSVSTSQVTLDYRLNRELGLKDFVDTEKILTDVGTLFDHTSRGPYPFRSSQSRRVRRSGTENKPSIAL
jgi:hypothetical protein